LQVFGGNAGRESGFQHLTERRHVVLRNPATKPEYVRPEQGGGVDDFLHRVDLEIRCILSEPDDETVGIALPERHDDAAADLDRHIHLIDKSASQRQAHRDIDKHGELRSEAKQLGANLFHVFPDFALFVRRAQ
jgi:hypothetical protein